MQTIWMHHDSKQNPMAALFMLLESLWKGVKGFYFYLTDYKRTSLGKYVKYFDQFLDGMARSWKGELLRKSGTM